MSSLQASAEKMFQKLSRPENLPSRKNENYRLTALKNLPFEKTPKVVDGLGKIPAELSSEIVLRSGAKGIYQNQSSLKVFETDAKLPEVFEEDLFAQLVVARALASVEIRVPRGQKLADPVSLLHYLGDESHTFFDRVRIVLEEESALTLVEELSGPGLVNGSAPFYVGCLEVEVQKNARLNWYQAQTMGPHVRAFVRNSVKIGENAAVRVQGAYAGSNVFQLRSDVECVGQGASFQFEGASRGKSQQSLDFWMTSRHPVSDTQSDTKLLTVMSEKARGAFNGTIVIPDTGIRTDASQKNKNILLDKTASVLTLPKLEIATDDVKCAHGASVSPVEEDQITYLRSRGIPESEARQMIIEGFTGTILDHFPESDQARLRELFR